MWKHLAIVVLLLCCGCTSRTPQKKYGNHASAESAALVHEVVSLLQASYPPAQTRLVLLQMAEDAFGSALLKTLRASGYAIAEYEPPAKGDKYMQADQSPRVLCFAYVLDDSEPGELQLVINVGVEVFSRTYTVKGEGKNAVYSAKGYWTRKQLLD